jgi:DNA-directed RNA polymerase specialized sigma24 family protein
MDEWSGCSCPLCKVEQALIEQFAEKQTARQYYDVARRSPILSGFPTALALLRRVRETTTDQRDADSSDEILGELLRRGEIPSQGLRQHVLLLILMPALHRTSRQIAHGFPSLARDDVAQQLITSLLQILRSKSMLKQQSHFAFTITRLMRRQAFRWAIREAKLAPTQELAMPIVAEAVVEHGFETTIHLREFLRGCLDEGQLTKTEYDLLMLFKIEGVSAEALAAREGLSEIAFRHRMQRVVDKLRRIAQSPSRGAERRAVAATTSASFRPSGRRISAA